MKNSKGVLAALLVGFLLLQFGVAHDGYCQWNGDCGNGKECKPLYLLNSDTYPTQVMDRYNFIRFNYSWLRFIADCYFALVNAFFSLFNAFQPIQHVGQWQNASQLLFLRARDAAHMIRNRQLSSKALVSVYIERIKTVNPMLNAMVYTNFDDALKQAAEIDSKLAGMSRWERNKLAKTMPLYGLPFTSKNNMEAKGFVITACNQAFIDANSISTNDATVVARVKAAGAILIGVSGMPNLGLSVYCDDSACGVMNNPHDTRRTPGGSSSGEAAIITSAGSLFGIGNDIGGSLRIPSHNCGVFGLKATSYPSHTLPFDGIVPNFAAYPPAADMLSTGPICRYASDLPLIFSAIKKPHHHNLNVPLFKVLANQSINVYDKKVDFSNNFHIYYLEELEILVTESLHPEQRESIRKVKNYFEKKYNLTVPKVNFPIMNRELELWALTGYTPGVQPIYPNLTEQFAALLRQTKGGQLSTTWVFSEHEFLRNFISPKDEVETKFVADKLNKLRRQLGTLLGKNGVLAMPVIPTEVPYHHSEPFKPFNLVYAKLFNVLGLPSIVVPTGKSRSTNMPLGVQIIGAPFNEALLIAVARELENAFGGWVNPGKMIMGQGK